MDVPVSRGEASMGIEYGAAQHGGRIEALLQEAREMAFVNEYIPAEDVKKYGIKEIDKRFVTGGTKSDQWTIDRERDIYLRCVSRGREEFRSESTWTLYWRGSLIYVDLKLTDGGGTRGGHGWSHYKLLRAEIPTHLEAQRADILKDLKEALTAYKGGGVFSTRTTSTTTLDI